MFSLLIHTYVYGCGFAHRIHEKKDHQLSFKQVASGHISMGYLDPTDGELNNSFAIYSSTMHN